MAVIALYGGSFDPITSGHLILIFEVLNSQLCDQVWILPSGDGREDKNIKVKSIDRLRMCQLAIQDTLGQLGHTKDTLGQLGHTKDLDVNGICSDCSIQVCNIEVREGFIPSYLLISRLQREYPQHEFQLVIGSDLINKLFIWDDSYNVLNKIRFLIIPRIPYKNSTTQLSSSYELSHSGSIQSIQHRLQNPECQCGMVQRDFPVDPDHHPIHWQCLKCTMNYRCQWIMIESNISSTEIRKRIHDICQMINHRHMDNIEGESSSQLKESVTRISTTKNTLRKHQLKMALNNLVPLIVIQYITDHQLYS